ncbi:Crp/Fnr family transcriptional regulator [Streptomyces sp. NPDC008238]
MTISAALGDRVPYLARLEDGPRDDLLSLGLPQSRPPNTVVLHEGEPSSHVLLVLSGWLKVTASSANGHEALLGLRGPGDVVGELAAVDGSLRSARVSTLYAVRLVAVRSADFLPFLERHPRAAIALLGVPARPARRRVGAQPGRPLPLPVGGGRALAGRRSGARGAGGPPRRTGGAAAAATGSPAGPWSSSPTSCGPAAASRCAARWSTPRASR